MGCSALGAMCVASDCGVSLGAQFGFRAGASQGQDAPRGISYPHGALVALEPKWLSWHPVLGRIIGGIIEVGIQMGVEGKSFSQIDKADVVVP